jgi:hypothetical protein
MSLEMLKERCCKHLDSPMCLDAVRSCIDVETSAFPGSWGDVAVKSLTGLQYPAL